MRKKDKPRSKSEVKKSIEEYIECLNLHYKDREKLREVVIESIEEVYNLAIGNDSSIELGRYINDFLSYRDYRAKPIIISPTFEQENESHFNNNDVAQNAQFLNILRVVWENTDIIQAIIYFENICMLENWDDVFKSYARIVSKGEYAIIFKVDGQYSLLFIRLDFHEDDDFVYSLKSLGENDDYSSLMNALENTINKSSFNYQTYEALHEVQKIFEHQSIFKDNELQGKSVDFGRDILSRSYLFSRKSKDFKIDKKLSYKEQIESFINFVNSIKIVGNGILEKKE